MPVEELRLGTQQNSFRKRSRTCAEVKGSLAHIHSRQIRWVCTRLFLDAASRAGSRHGGRQLVTKILIRFRLAECRKGWTCP
ncbi:Unknown protein sequence [Pseudomonas coronafaciens pv. oryzae]|nr:Unknown protein sequence [Pseudomonas coronafaciens pv. oryzae]